MTALHYELKVNIIIIVLFCHDTTTKRLQSASTTLKILSTVTYRLIDTNIISI